MNMIFADTMKRLREEKGLSRKDLEKQMYVTRSTIARWENGSRLPDAVMIARLSEVLNVDINILLSAAAKSDEYPNVILVDDSKLILTGSLPVLEEVMPNATVMGFIQASDAVEYAKANRVAQK